MKIPLDCDELKKSNVLVTGSNQQGKSLLAMSVSDALLYQNSESWQIIVFDNVGHWKNKSSIPYFIQVSDNNLKCIIPKKESIIYDISRLLPVNQKEFVENVLAGLWRRKLDGLMPKWTLIIFEEAHLYMRNTRSLVSQNIMRIFSVGANYNVRCLALTPCLTGLDSEYVRLTNQRYHFRLGKESNALKRFRSWYTKDFQRIASDDLKQGWCLYYLDGKMEVRKIPLFQSSVTPQSIRTKPIIKEKLSIKQKKVSTMEIAGSLLTAPFKILEPFNTSSKRIRQIIDNLDKEDDELEEIDGLLILDE